MKISYVILVASLMIAVGSWGANHDNWSDLTQVSHVFELVGIIGAVLLAWLGKSPIPNTKKNGSIRPA